MNEEELIRETRKLIGRWDNIRIVGQGWAGDSRRGFQFNPIRTTSPEGTTPVTPSGACCPPSGDCFISTQAVCVGGGGTYQGDGTTCTPDPCTPDTGACCVGSGCSIETESDCIGMGGVFQGVDTTCSPNPCPPHTGACCVGTDCSIETEDDCAGMGGAYQGDDTVCDPNPCTTPPCICGFDAFDFSGRKFLRYQRSITGTTHSEEHNGCSPPDNNDVIIDASCSAIFQAHYEPNDLPCTAITDVDASSSSHLFTSNGTVIDSCSLGDFECFCSTIPPFNECAGGTFYGEVTSCACNSPSNNTTVTATTRVYTHTYNEDCSVPCFVCIGCNEHCTSTVSYTVTETLSEECIPT